MRHLWRSDFGAPELIGTGGECRQPTRRGPDELTPSRTGDRVLLVNIATRDHQENDERSELEVGEGPQGASVSCRCAIRGAQCEVDREPNESRLLSKVGRRERHMHSQETGADQRGRTVTFRKQVFTDRLSPSRHVAFRRRSRRGI